MNNNVEANPYPKGPQAARRAQGYDKDFDRAEAAESKLRDITRALSFIPGDVWLQAIKDADAVRATAVPLAEIAIYSLDAWKGEGPASTPAGSALRMADGWHAVLGREPEVLFNTLAEVVIWMREKNGATHVHAKGGFELRDTFPLAGVQ